MVSKQTAKKHIGQLGIHCRKSTAQRAALVLAGYVAFHKDSAPSLHLQVCKKDPRDSSLACCLNTGSWQQVCCQVMLTNCHLCRCNLKSHLWARELCITGAVNGQTDLGTRVRERKGPVYLISMFQHFFRLKFSLKQEGNCNSLKALRGFNLKRYFESTKKKRRSTSQLKPISP